MSRLELDLDHAAIVAIHWQNDVVRSEAPYGIHFAKTVAEWGTIARTQAVYAAARAAGVGVVHVRVAYGADQATLITNAYVFRHAAATAAFLHDSRGVQLIDELSPEPGEAVVDHVRSTCFYGTDLDIVLRGMGVRSILLTGVATNVAVEGTAREALDLDYDVTVIGDCCATASLEVHEGSLRRLELVANRVLTADETLARFAGR